MPRCLDLPKFPCMSCNKLSFRRDCVILDSCLKPITRKIGKDYWNTLTVTLALMMGCLMAIFV